VQAGRQQNRTFSVGCAGTRVSEWGISTARRARFRPP
jgi:hypothetical protein